MRCAKRSHLVLGRALAALCLAAGSASATDGVIELNHAKALAGSVVPNDGPGYPVLLDLPGSYRLTGDLVVPAGVNGILVGADEVVLDLNGFAVRGGFVCNPGACAAGAEGGIRQQTPLLGDRSSVRNGTVSGFPGEGVRLGEGSLVAFLGLWNLGADAIVLGQSSVAEANRVAGVGRSALVAGPSSTFRDNLFVDTNRGGSGALAVSGWSNAAGGNVCLDHSCSPRGARRYYLTPGKLDGASAEGACALGYHFASLFEIAAPGELEYDWRRGLREADSGSGPPKGTRQALLLGWTRTGFLSSPGDSPGRGNCREWTSSSGADHGSQIGFWYSWPAASGSASASAPWFGQTSPCAVPASVWCVED